MAMRLDAVIKSLSTANAAIKNTASPTLKAGWYPTFSASGQDVWLPNYRFNQKGIVVSAVGARCGKAFKADGKWNICANTHALSVDESIADRDYCWYLLNNEEWWIKGGTAQPFVKVKESLKREFEFPSLSEQRAIVRQLDTITRIIDLKSAEFSALDTLVKSRFVEMFGDETNPKRWPVVAIETIAESTVGVVIKPAQYYTDAEHGVRTFRSLNIGPMCIKDASWVYFSQEGHAKNAKSQLQENDLLIVRSGAPGTACVIPAKYAGSNAIDVIIARPNTAKVNPHYLCMFTNMPHGKRQIEGGIGGAAQQHFNVGKYNRLQLFLPPLALQNQFAAFVSQVEHAQASIRASLAKTQTLFDSLMQEYFG